MEGYGLDSSGLEYRLVADSCKHGNELPASIKCWRYRVAEYLLASQDELCSM
jgi:hypothetical protein